MARKFDETRQLRDLALRLRTVALQARPDIADRLIEIAEEAETVARSLEQIQGKPGEE
jgi:hypothetical protein